MDRCFNSLLCCACAAALLAAPMACSQEVSIGGFIPFVGIGMTDESKTLDSLDLGDIPFIADPEFSLGAPLLGSGGGYFDIALLDTGAATHILTEDAFNGFDLAGAGLRGENIQNVGGATGVIVTEINDAAGLYMAGLGDRTAAGAELKLNTSKLRGQTSVATLTAPAEDWSLPNILGLPMAAQHAIVIRNDLPQVFEHQGRTIRTPQVEFIDLGTGADQGITRRAPLILNPGIGFIQGPQFVFNLAFDDLLTSGGEIDIANNPASPSVVQDSNGNGGGMFLEVDLYNDGKGFEDKQLLFDTGADLTVISQITAKRLGFDAVLDEPDFVLEVEGSGGVQGGIPGFYVDELNIDTIGGSFTLQNVPVAVLDVTNPNDPGNIIDGIIGMHLFNGRNIVIDAEASFGQGGVGPSLYISDPVTNVRTWNRTGFGGTRTWSPASNWQENATPDQLSDVQIVTTTPGLHEVALEGNQVANRVTIAGEPDPNSQIGLTITPGAELTVFGEVRIDEGGNLFLDNGALDAQFVNIFGGRFGGTGDVFVGTGTIENAVRNLSGTVAPGDGFLLNPLLTAGTLSIVGDFSSQENATLDIDIFELEDTMSNDLLETSRLAFLAGTLDVSYTEVDATADGLQVGETFTILTADEGVFGQFDTLLLPHEYLWDVNYLANSVVLEVTGIGIPGDLNSDGSVDLGDYSTWRDGYGERFTIEDFSEWKTAFYSSGGGGGGLGVPEPASGAAALLLILGVACRARPARAVL